MSETPPKPTPFTDGFVRVTAIMCFVGLGGFLLWAGFAPLAEGVPASGQIVVENNRQVVQHLEGGIIRELMVRDGDFVEAGDPLVLLEETASLATRDEILQELAGFTASLARLNALSDGLDEPDYSLLAEIGLGDAERAAVLSRQTDLFNQQKQSFEADIAVLTARRDGANTARALLAQQIVVTRRVLASARDQLRLLTERYDRQMARLDELRGMEREVSTLEAEISRLQSQAQSSETLELDLNGQIAQAEALFQRQISSELLDVRTSLLAAEERLNAAQDVLNRVVIHAPQAGEVLNLQFSTRGGVVRPGETILEIVPEVGDVTASVRIQPNNRAAVFEGLAVRTQLTAFKSWQTPRLDGEVVGVSADLKMDQITGAPYYEVRVNIPPAELGKLGELEVIPGMPVEVFIYSGSSRTTLDYLLEPISESLFRGSRGG
jgi:HlyD family type I secretion membrane fusion protein